MTGMRDPLDIGPMTWNVDPVRASMVAAHLTDVRRGMHAATPAVPAGAATGVTGPAPHQLLRRSRVRVGHAIVALGGFVAGRHEHGDGSAMHAL